MKPPEELRELEVVLKELRAAYRKLPPRPRDARLLEIWDTHRFVIANLHGEAGDLLSALAGQLFADEMIPRAAPRPA